ncbi:MAG: hypothetical protein NT003_03600 [Candidatus Magasanikbacteria bacterium]|nr:hypothetical protein [Candidatus Magasanikbacteria bacterium]
MSQEGTITQVLEEIKKVNVRLGSLETNVGSLEVKVGSLETKIDSLETKVDANHQSLFEMLAESVVQQAERFDGVEKRMEDYEIRMDEIALGQRKLWRHVEQVRIDVVGQVKLVSQRNNVLINPLGANA